MTALSAESILTFVVWTASPALTVVLALSVSPSAPLLLAAGLMVAAAAGLWALPAGWEPDGDDHDGVSKGRTLARAWPIFVTGAAAASLFALVELTLPALLEQRAIHVGWAGPLLAGFSIAAIAWGHPVRCARKLAGFRARAEHGPAAGRRPRA